MANIQYSLVDIIETEFKFNYDFDFSSYDKKDILIQFRYSLIPLPKDNILNIELEARYTTKENVIIANNTIRAVYNIQPLTEAIEITDESLVKTIKAPELIETLVSVTIGSLRGILMKNLKNTSMESNIIPLIPMTMIRNMIKG